MTLPASPSASIWTSSIPPTRPALALRACGVTYREAHLAMEMIADTESMVSLEVVEINPILDEHNRTALLGVELVLSGLGQKIL